MMATKHADCTPIPVPCCEQNIAWLQRRHSAQMLQVCACLHTSTGIIGAARAHHTRTQTRRYPQDVTTRQVHNLIDAAQVRTSAGFNCKPRHKRAHMTHKRTDKGACMLALEH